MRMPERHQRRAAPRPRAELRRGGRLQIWIPRSVTCGWSDECWSGERAQTLSQPRARSSTASKQPLCRHCVVASSC